MRPAAATEPATAWQSGGIRYNSWEKQLILDLIPAPTPTFDNFVPGRNAEALQSCKDGSPLLSGAIAINSSKILYFWGAPGSGKTHLLRSLDNIDGTLFLTAADLETEIQERLRYVVDDVQSLTDVQQVGLFNLINRINEPREPQNSSQVIVAGIAAPRDLALRPELTSRLGSGLVFQLHPLSETEKAAALRAHAKTRSFTLREEVIAYLLRHARRDMASLIAMLDALDIHSLETGREITLPLLREISQPELSSSRSGSLVNSLPTPSPNPPPDSLPNLLLTIPTQSL